MFRLKNLNNVKPGDLIKHPGYFRSPGYFRFHAKDLAIVINVKYFSKTTRLGGNLDFCRIDHYYLLTYISNNEIKKLCLNEQEKFKLRVWCDK
jgi:hypothetical protein